MLEGQLDKYLEVRWTVKKKQTLGQLENNEKLGLLEKQKLEGQLEK